MKILKSLGDGIGTGAGVAWPTFGLIFGTLGLGIGALASIIIGSLSAALFIFVLLPITYWSYNDYFETKEKLNRKISEQKQQTTELIFNYLLSILKKCIFKSKKKTINTIDTQFLINEMKNEIRNNISKNTYKSPIKQYLTDLLDDQKSNHFLMKFICAFDKRKSHFTDDHNPVIKYTSNNKGLLKKTIKHTYKQYDDFSPSPLNTKSRIKAVVMGFAAGYGSLAGCSAGVLGVLGAVGIFAGLAAVPVVGWTILAASAIFGIITASICVNIAAEKNKKKQLYKHYKKTNYELEEAVKFNNIKIDADIEAQRKYKYNFKLNINNQITHKRTKRSYSTDNICSFKNHPIWHTRITSNKEIIKNESDTVHLIKNKNIYKRM